MLTPQQQDHFATFGFLRLPQLFSAEEMAAFTTAADALWTQNEEPPVNDEIRLGQVVERDPLLRGLATDDRVWPAVEALMGPGFIWVGSEGNISNRAEIKWHSDRKYYRSSEEHWIDYPQVKLMLYLDELHRDSGCLRVIPGSHRMPLHKNLAAQEIDPDARPFGVDPREIPCTALASTPGDAVFFHHCLWHASFGGGVGRRYIALKFAAKPTAADQLVSLERYTATVFAPHEAFCRSDHPRIRAMIEPLTRYADGILETTP